MSAETLLQFLTNALFVLIFLVVVANAARRPRRVSIDTALFFGAMALIVFESWVTAALRLGPDPVLTVVIGSLLMALPYLLMRLGDDFAGLPRPLLRFAEAGLSAAIVTLVIFSSTKTPLWLALLYVAYFVGLTVYVSVVFMRTARRSGGVTMRRMQAVASGSLFLGLAILVDGVMAAVPAWHAWLVVLSQICALLSGLSYYVGFAPPTRLRRAWQEPEVRAFLGRAARLPHLPDTRAIVRELEQGAADSLGAPRATIGLWDGEAQALRFKRLDGTWVELPSGHGLAGRAYATQRPLLSDDAAHDDPALAAVYRASNAKSILAVPITAGEKRLGVLTLDAPRSPIFAEDDLQLARLLADQAAVILESRALIDEAARVQAHAEATRLKDDFLSAAAHDLKTPLTAIIVQAQLLEHRARRDPAAPADAQGIERITHEALRLKRLVLDLLDVAQAEQGRLIGTREPVDLVALAREACVQHSSPHHQCQLDAHGEIIGIYDRNRIHQLVDNLLENAVKYSPNGGEVHITVWREDNEVHLSVADQGIGIPAADLPRLFDRFYRGANVDDRSFAGMGLGLYICSAIVAQHGGRLWAESSGPGHGSTFHVVLPIAARAAESDDGAIARPVPVLAAAEETR